MTQWQNIWIAFAIVFLFGFLVAYLRFNRPPVSVKLVEKIGDHNYKIELSDGRVYWSDGSPWHRPPPGSHDPRDRWLFDRWKELK